MVVWESDKHQPHLEFADEYINAMHEQSDEYKYMKHMFGNECGERFI